MDRKSMKRQITIVAFAMLLLYFGNFVYALWSKQSGGTFGDTFGAVNALFFGAALFFLIQAYLLQRDELEVVREERNDTRRLLEGQERLARSERTALEQQRFEASVFSMLELISRERHALDGNSRIAPPASSIQVGYSAAVEFLRRLDDQRGREPSSIASQFPDAKLRPSLRLCLLIAAAYSAIEGHELRDAGVEVQLLTLRTFIDADLATIWAAMALGLRSADMEPLRRAFADLTVVDSVHPSVRPHLRRILGDS